MNDHDHSWIMILTILIILAFRNQQINQFGAAATKVAGVGFCRIWERQQGSRRASLHIHSTEYRFVAVPLFSSGIQGAAPNVVSSITKSTSTALTVSLSGSTYETTLRMCIQRYLFMIHSCELNENFREKIHLFNVHNLFLNNSN